MTTTTFYIIGFIVLCIGILLYRTKPKGMSFSQYMNNNNNKAIDLFVSENIPHFQSVLGLFFIFCGLNLFYTPSKIICGDIISEKTTTYNRSSENPEQYVNFVLKDSNGILYKDNMELDVYKTHKGEICIDRMGDLTKLFTTLTILSLSLIILLIFFRDDF